MILRYTTDQLIESVRQRASLPDVGALGATDADIVRVLSECFRSVILPGVIKIHEEYGVITRRVSLVATKVRYRIPGRAAGLRLRSVCFVETSGTRRIMTRLERKDLVNLGDSTGSSYPTAYYLEGPYIVLCPEVGASWGSGYLEMSYYCRPGDLVMESDARQITAIGPTTYELSLNATAPPSWLAAGPFDIHGQESGAEIKCMEFAAAALVDNVMTVTDAILNGTDYGTLPVQVGDWVCLSGEAAIPGIPTELHIPLTRAAAAELLWPLDPDAAGGCWEEFKFLMQQAGYLVDSRIETAPPKVVARNPLYGDTRR